MTVEHQSRSIAYFISPHGFGHAARASAVMRAVQEKDPSIRFEVFTTIPEWFFENSMVKPFGYHSLLTDIGLVQRTPFEADLSETVRRLDEFLPFDPSTSLKLAETMVRLKCELVACDIAPMGIAVARASGIPSLLIENFTWDWVYEEYASTHDRLKRHMEYLSVWFSEADYHVQAEPVCAAGAVDRRVPPVSRRPGRSRAQIRDLLGIPDGSRMLLITMGGIPERYPFLKTLALPEGVHVVVPGSAKTVKREGHVILLPHRSRFFHPDLVSAADGVIGKVGYSTVAEVYHAGVPYGFIKRTHFRESDILGDYIGRHMAGFAISEPGFMRAEWVEDMDRLLSLPRKNRKESKGALKAAEFVCDILNRKRPRAED